MSSEKYEKVWSNSMLQAANDSYKVDSLTAETKLSLIYSAWSSLNNSQVLLKVLKPEFLKNKAAQELLRREARFLSSLSHENVVRIVDFELSDSGLDFLILDYLEGKSLPTLVQENNGISYQAALPIFAQVCDGISAAHKAGVLHNGLEPDSIFLAFNKSKNDFAKIIDFSAATLETESPLEFYRDNLECHMSPEQLKGKPIDTASDIFRLAALFYEVLMASPAFSAQQVHDYRNKIMTLHPASFKKIRPDLDIPEAFENALERALNTQAALRYKSVNEFKNAMFYSLGIDSSNKLNSLIETARSILFRCS